MGSYRPVVAPQPLRIRLLGGLDVEGTASARLGSRKARTLLKVLALGRGSVVATGAVCEVLWADGDAPARPVDQVGVLVSRLRRVLGPDRLERAEGGWLLAVDWLDVAELEARAAEALERLDAGQHAAARTAARAALDLVRGPLLPDDEGAWVEGERARCERLGGRVRLVAAEAALRAGDTSTAAAEAERALDVDPFDEAALRTAMRAHVAGGRPASALALYARTRRHLADELGVSPTAETEALHDSVVLVDETSAPAVVAPAPPLVGRAVQLERLRAAAEQVGSSGGGSLAVEIVGDAGIGKTALLDAWAASSPMTVLRSRCDEHARDLPLQPVLDALGVDGHEPSPVERPGATSVVDPVVGRTLLFADLLRRVAERAGPAGVALVLDDIQWADPMTVAFCRVLRRRADRCLLVVAGRTGSTVDIAADRHVVVPALDLDAVTELVGPERAPALLDRSGGNPLFLRHLAAGAGDGVPASVREAVTLRVEQLGPDVATVIRAAAVFGVEIDLDLLAAVLRTPAVELLGHLDIGAVHGLIDDRGVLAFSHALVRDALVAGTPPSRLAWLHREAAGVLAARVPVDEPAVARHARAGGDRVLASASLVRAGAATAARFDLAGAEALLDEAISLDDTPSARLARARVRLARHRLDEAAGDADAAATLGAGAEAFEVAGWIAYYQRDHGRAVRHAEEGAARADDDGVRASCLALRGRVRHSAGDLAGAEAALAEALRIAPGGVRGLAQVWLSGVRSHQSRPVEALDLADRALLRPHELGHPFAPLHGRFARVTALGHAGRVGEALAAVDEALVRIAEQGEQAARFTSIFLNGRGWLLRNLGLLAEADAANLQALAAVAPGAQTGEPFHVAHLDLLDGAIARDDAADIARRLAEASAIDTWDGSMSWRQKARLDLLRARLALRGGETDRACALAASVRDRAAAWPVPRYRLLAELVIDEAAARTGTADRDAVAGRLRALDDVAAPEAWWRTAELAVALDDQRLAAEADRRAEAIAAGAATARPDAATAVTAHLRRIRSR